MNFSEQWLSFCGLLILLSSFSFACRSLLLDRLRRVLRNEESVHVTPVELAYLLRPDDSVHALLVMTVDLLHKGLKSPSSVEAEVSASEFKQEVWNMVKEYIKNWSLQKSEKLLPELRTRNPVHILSGLWRIRLFVLDMVKGFLSDVIKDPLHLRKYFSVKDLLKMFVSALSTNMRVKLRTSLQESLLAKNLLVEAESCLSCSKKLLLICLLHFAISVAVCVFMPSELNWITSIVLTCMSLFNVLLLRILGGLRSLIPFYDEVSLVLRSISRGGFRIAIMRGLLGVIGKALFTVTFLLAVIILSIQSFLLYEFLFPHSYSWLLCSAGVLAFSINLSCVLDAFFQSSEVANTDQITSEGRKVIARVTSRVRNIGPISALTNMLSDSDYTEQLSEVVAVYGIETLILLA